MTGPDRPLPVPVPSRNPADPAAHAGADLLARIRAITPARLLVGRAGTSYRTSTLLGLRADHAAARDAVVAPVDPDDPALSATLAAADALHVRSRAGDLAQHLRRPDLGRRLSPESAALVREACPRGADLQLVVGAGLSSAAVHAQVPVLLPLLLAGARDRGWTVGRTLVVEHCRVGVLNEVGALLDPRVVVLLVGERPGLATAESLSAYLAHRPRPGDTDASRSLLSNIHAGGVPPERAAPVVLDLVARALDRGATGVDRSGAGTRSLPSGALSPPGASE